jgi:hypothetical protein
MRGNLSMTFESLLGQKVFKKENPKDVIKEFGNKGAD